MRILRPISSPRPDPELFTVLGRWEGSKVAVRVVAAATDELVASFAGRLRARSDEKHPVLFWPVESTESPAVERLGIYLHPDSYESARVHEGEFVVEFEQAGVTTNVRLLDQNPS
jgi:hypothetical protein